MKIALLIGLILNFIPYSYADESVSQICSISLGGKRLSSIADTKKSICDLVSMAPGSEVERLAIDSLAILDRIQASGEDLRSGQFYQSLDQLAHSINTTLDLSESNLSSDLSLFIKKFNDPEKRKDQSAYLEDIRGIMENSPLGRKALDCFYGNESNFSGGEIRFIAPDEKTLLGTFSVEKESDGRFKKVLQFDLRNSSPDRALSLVAHEMMHACDAERFALDDIETELARDKVSQKQAQLAEIVMGLQRKISDLTTLTKTEKDKAIEKIELFSFGITTSEDLLGVVSGSDLDQLENAVKDLKAAAQQADDVKRFADQNAAISELKAYKWINVDFFKELAKQSPKYFCNQVTPSIFQGGIVSYGESRSFLEESINNRTFMFDLIKNYSQSNGYLPQSFFEQKVTPDGSTIFEFSFDDLSKRKLDPRFEEAINQAYEALKKSP